MRPLDAWADLPGGEILREGLGQHGARDLRRDSSVYRMLRGRASADAFGEYNAWLRRLASLCHVLELRARLS